MTIMYITKLFGRLGFIINDMMNLIFFYKIVVYIFGSTAALYLSTAALYLSLICTSKCLEYIEASST